MDFWCSWVFLVIVGAFWWLTNIWQINLWVSRRSVRKTYCQDDICSGWPAALGHLSGLCLPGQIVARPTPVYTRIFSYYFSSNLICCKVGQKGKIRNTERILLTIPSIFWYNVFFSEIEKSVRGTVVYKESVIKAFSTFIAQDAYSVGYHMAFHKPCCTLDLSTNLTGERSFSSVKSSFVGATSLNVTKCFVT